MKAYCVFCPSLATEHRGEHIFDDWLNRENGRIIKDTYTFTEHGEDDRIVRTFKSSLIAQTMPVVCDTCNSTWMSDLTNKLKQTCEGIIRHERLTTLLPLGIATLAAFAFMK